MRPQKLANQNGLPGRRAESVKLLSHGPTPLAGFEVNTQVSAFLAKLQEAIKRNSSMLCVGLDPDPRLMPDMPVASFLCEIIEATKDLVCAYKPNLAFYEALGIEGWRALQTVLRAIPKDIVTIGDGKRGDIENTSDAYAKAAFDVWGFDAATVAPYMGSDSIYPFIEYADKGVLVVCRTSNPGGDDFQLLEAGGRPLYEFVALKAKEWNTKQNVGFVTGSTRPGEVRRVRELCPDMPLLIPGIGAQSGDLEASVRGGLDGRGSGIIVSTSRHTLYASKASDFAGAARQSAQTLRDAIRVAARHVCGNSS